MANTPTARTELKWAQMSAVSKLVWWGKLLIALASFGFVFPHVMDPRIRDDTR